LKNGFKLLQLVAVITIVAVAFGCHSKKVDPNQRVYVGYFQQNHDVQISPTQFKNPKMIRPHVVAWGADFSKPCPTTQIIGFQKLNIVPMIAWEPRLWTDTSHPITLESISKGEWDKYLKQWAQAIRSTELPVLISFAPEFNSQEFPWSVANNGQDGQKYVDAYRHVVSIFRSEGVSNAIFVWTFLAVSSPKAAWNEPLSMYPGDEYVDWIGLASVNQSSDMQTMFSATLANVAANYSTKPIMITRYYYEPGKESNRVVVDALQTDLKSVKAIVFSNPKTLTMDPVFFKTPLFQASVEEFAFLHL